MAHFMIFNMYEWECPLPAVLFLILHVILCWLNSDKVLYLLVQDFYHFTAFNQIISRV